MKYFFLIGCFFYVAINNAQIKAVTETGDEVILYDNNTWTYVNEESIEETEISLNPKKFERNSENTFLVKSSSLDLGIYINPKVWSFKKAIQNADAEYEFQIQNGDLYAMMITEKIEVPLHMLKNIVVENARTVAPDAKIVEEEYRMVNGNKVLMLRLLGTTQGIKFSYFGYYYSYSGGTVQVITYSSENLLNEFNSQAEDLLNGLVSLFE